MAPLLDPPATADLLTQLPEAPISFFADLLAAIKARSARSVLPKYAEGLEGARDERDAGTKRFGGPPAAAHATGWRDRANGADAVARTNGRDRVPPERVGEVAELSIYTYTHTYTRAEAVVDQVDVLFGEADRRGQSKPSL